jgi:hypothetical protein
MFRPSCRTYLCLASVVFLNAGLARAEVVWVEGESASTKDVTPHAWYGGVKKEQLSGGDWASHFNATKPGLLGYDLKIPADGEYAFFVRANPVGAKLSYRLGEGAWTEIEMDKGQTDNTNIAGDGKVDIRFLAWVKVGSLKLKKGDTHIDFKMHSGNNNHGGLDCFVLTTEPFTPNGKLKPGQKLGLSMPGTWAFEPDNDPFDKASPIDLRSLNEKKAGESGWVKRTADGDFVLGSGKPVRFWAVNTTVYNRDDLDALRLHAKHLAKRGINMVRFHGAIGPKGKDDKLTDVDATEIDRMQQLVAVMKEEGIYTTISPYWAATARPNPKWGLSGNPSGGPWGMLFWDETLQTGYKAWLKEMLTRPSKYTGIPLGKDPAFALLQIQNEDSMLFWTIQGVKGDELKALQKAYGKWLTTKYTSLDKASTAWGGEKVDGDDLPNGVAGFYGMWEFHPGQGANKAKRLADQMQFYAETMHHFNQMIGDYVHKELACPVLINAGNWRTANQITLLDAERWSYTANDVVGSNRYVGGAHINPTEGQKAGWAVSKGDFFEDISVLNSPRKLAINHKQVVGMPLIISESTWVPPMSYQSEGPFLTAAYSGLTGVDCLYWFAVGEPTYDKTINKWQAANPAIMGSWPATALLFRKDYVKRGEAVVHEERRLSDLWTMQSTLLAEEEGFDPNRDATSVPKESSVRQAVNPLAYLVGPVEVKYEGDPAKNRVADFSKYIDEDKKIIKSITGELEWDYGIGVCRLNAL